MSKAIIGTKNDPRYSRPIIVARFPVGAVLPMGTGKSGQILGCALAFGEAIDLGIGGLYESTGDGLRLMAAVDAYNEEQRAA